MLVKRAALLILSRLGNLSFLLQISLGCEQSPVPSLLPQCGPWPLSAIVHSRRHIRAGTGAGVVQPGTTFPRHSRRLPLSLQISRSVETKGRAVNVVGPLAQSPARAVVPSSNSSSSAASNSFYCRPGPRSV